MITGASSGIGKSCAQVFARNGYKIILSARRIELIRKLADELKADYGSESICVQLDVRNKMEVNHVVDNLTNQWKNISVLVNNAGLALGLHAIDEGDTEEWDVMIDTNIKGLLYVSRAIIPLMKSGGDGHIINIGSISGREVYPKGNVYCSTKHAVDALTRAMRIDLLPYRIKVTQVSPGAVETEFSLTRFRGDTERAKAVYDGYTPLTPDDVAEVVYFCADRPPHVNINDVLFMPAQQANAVTFNKNL